MVDFQAITGTYFDNICQNAGLRNTRLRVNNGAEITPTPLMSHMGQVPTTDIGFELEDAESLDTWETSIPMATLASRLGANWRTFVAPDQLWQIDDGNGWKVYRSYGQPEYSNADAGDRVKVVFKADANTVDLLGLEAPYVP